MCVSCVEKWGRRLASRLGGDYPGVEVPDMEHATESPEVIRILGVPMLRASVPTWQMVIATAAALALLVLTTLFR